MNQSIETAVSAFGSSAKAKLSNPGASGQPEDQLRSPFEQLLQDVGALLGFAALSISAVGESKLNKLKTRPDYAVTVHNALIGFVELKAPGKGADPRKFTDPHDKEQWEKLHSLPNLLYFDGNQISLWQDGKIVESVLHFEGDVETSGTKLKPPAGLTTLFASFLNWKPIAPGSARELAHITARLCRLLRDEVTEQLDLANEDLAPLATDWRKMLFPDATNERFADGYAQAVVFGMLMARANDIDLSTGLEQAAAKLTKTSSLIGAAMRLLTEQAEEKDTLATSLQTLIRVLGAVQWKKISKGDTDAWLYFYEEFLAIYDNELRKQTGSYYTPPEVVSAMVSQVDEVLRSPRFNLHQGAASPVVTFADPAVGTGTFILGLLRKIAQTVEDDEGPGPVKGAVLAALNRLIAFEIQLGPFAVAQLRVIAEVIDLTESKTEHDTKPEPVPNLRMFVTDTLGNPYDDAEWLPGLYASIGRSRRDANKIKRDEPITVVIGNPPYKEKAKGRGGWIESANPNTKDPAPLQAWMPPSDWGVGAHAKHLRNLYIYFWRWATWKVFDHHPDHSTGIVCFITVAGFLAGPGFQKMRDYLRRKCDDIWVIDCSPEGHQPEVNTRIFQGVQQPICIVIASRSSKSALDTPARVRFRAVPKGKREEKFQALAKMRIEDAAWIECPTDWRAPFLPESVGAWASFPPIEDLFIYNGSGVMPGRTWIIAPDANSLEKRWNKLKAAPPQEMDELFQPHMDGDEVGDRHSTKILKDALHSFPVRKKSVAEDDAPMTAPIPYGFRSFDRQWIIPDKRLINRPNPELWNSRSDRQIYAACLARTSPKNGPALTFTAFVPDLDHYKGSFGGRIFPLWSDDGAVQPNLPQKLLPLLSKRIGRKIAAEDLIAYIAAVAANPAFTLRFQNDLSTPGLRIPITADSQLFSKACELGKRIVWLHTFGDRTADPSKGRPLGPPRMPAGHAPFISKEGAISTEKGETPEHIGYDAAKQRLLVGHGFVDRVPAAVWNYEVSGKQVLTQWFSYRKLHRERPIIGDRRQPSKLGEIQPDHWLPEYTTELLNVINVLSLLVELEPAQANLLDQICQGHLISESELKSSGATEKPKKKKKAARGKVKPAPLFAD